MYLLTVISLTIIVGVQAGEFRPQFPLPTQQLQGGDVRFSSASGIQQPGIRQGSLGPEMGVKVGGGLTNDRPINTNYQGLRFTNFNGVPDGSDKYTPPLGFSTNSNQDSNTHGNSFQLGSVNNGLDSFREQPRYVGNGMMNLHPQQ